MAWGEAEAPCSWAGRVTGDLYLAAFFIVGLKRGTSCHPFPYSKEEYMPKNLPMHPNLKEGNLFPDFELPDQEGERRKLSRLLCGFPGVLIFGRGYF